MEDGTLLLSSMQGLVSLSVSHRFTMYELRVEYGNTTYVGLIQDRFFIDLFLKKIKIDVY